MKGMKGLQLFHKKKIHTIFLREVADFKILLKA